MELQCFGQSVERVLLALGCILAGQACECREVSTTIHYDRAADQILVSRVVVQSDRPRNEESYVKTYLAGFSQPPTSLGSDRGRWSVALEFGLAEPGQPAALRRVRTAGAVGLWRHSLSSSRFAAERRFGLTPTLLPSPDDESAPPVPMDPDIGAAYFARQSPGAVCAIHRARPDRPGSEIRFYLDPDGGDPCSDSVVAAQRLVSCYVFASETVPLRDNHDDVISHVDLTVMKRFERSPDRFPMPPGFDCEAEFDGGPILGEPVLVRLELSGLIPRGVAGPLWSTVTRSLEGEIATRMLGEGVVTDDFPHSGNALMMALELHELASASGGPALAEPISIRLQQVVSLRPEPEQGAPPGMAQRATLYYEARGCEPLPEEAERSWASAEVSTIDLAGHGVLDSFERRAYGDRGHLLFEVHADTVGVDGGRRVRARRRRIRSYEGDRLAREFEVSIPADLAFEPRVSRVRTFAYDGEDGLPSQEVIRELVECPDSSRDVLEEDDSPIRPPIGSERWPGPRCPAG